MNPFQPHPNKIILGQVGGQSEAHLDMTETMVQLQYKETSEQIHELPYYYYLKGHRGIQKVFYAEDKKTIVERLYPFDTGLSKEILKEVFFQLIDLIELLYRNNMCNTHIEHFIMHKDNVVYFADCRLWEPLNQKGLKESLIQVCRFLYRHGIEMRDVCQRIYDYIIQKENIELCNFHEITELYLK